MVNVVIIMLCVNKLLFEVAFTLLYIMLSGCIRVLTTDTNELFCIVWFYNVLQKPIYDKLVWINTN